ncbi:hypothetical protein GN244_ATG07693 [Phytophthora infestans]|uniref:Uncharacterized protein n=1 Tax=Phytophthora infestans TaxID=4787 RepID=A0A833S466_PHYIN|nr:hypothetical protein GN244_ATG07693 [Phytophthora infestans]KAF4134382.1 hypothetical protein GN958_ATG16422 [Phytophthora infestans]
MEGVEEAALARFRAWCVGNDISPNFVSEVGVEVAEDEVVEAVARDQRNAHKRFNVKVLDDINAGVTVTEAARLHGIKSRTAVHGWIHLEAAIRDACNRKRRSKCSVNGQGRVNSFPYCDELIQWNKEESLGRLIRRLIYQQGFSLRRLTKSILSTVDLEAEQRAFAIQVGTKVNATYARSCIFNFDETAAYYDATRTRIISERSAKKSVKIRGRTRSERASALLIVSAEGQKLRPVIMFTGKPVDASKKRGAVFRAK